MIRHPDALTRVRFSTLVEGLEYAAPMGKGWFFHNESGRLVSAVSYAVAAVRAKRQAQALNGLGFARHARVGLIAVDSPDFLVSFFACQYAGLISCPLPTITYVGGREAYVERLGVLIRKARLTAVIGPGELGDTVEEAVRAAGMSGVRVLSYEETETLPPKGEVAPLRSDDPAYIQYSSGSTSDPKGVWLTQSAITSNIAMMLEFGLEARATNVAVSWLPLYHDMGFAGMVLASVLGISDTHFIAPSTFIRNPEVWVRLMSEKRAQTSFAPSFAWAMAARVPDPARFDLSGLRIAGVGGDTVRIEDLQQFAEAFKSAGFREECFLPTYGLSEAVLGVAFHKTGTAPVVRSLMPGGRPLVSVGKPLVGVELIVVDADGHEVGEGIVGFIWVRAPQIWAEYFDDPEGSAASVRRDGFRDTGDMGCFIDGNLFITGRSKDMILIRGRNIWPQDIELAAEKAVPGSMAAAFSVEDADAENVICFVQTPEAGEADTRGFVAAAAESVLSRVGVSVEVVVVPPDTISYTSAGKLSRAAAKEIYLKRFRSAPDQPET
ncbi:MAG: AMP-binding protein [Methylobacteriaceae bacterium]|jgi:fatty-acyl-CoA synthase|nr:AMP-binding protein [Methylobacteriaceae bacterium]